MLRDLHPVPTLFFVFFGVAIVPGWLYTAATHRMLGSTTVVTTGQYEGLTAQAG
jgi:hypothetical protein